MKILASSKGIYTCKNCGKRATYEIKIIEILRATFRSEKCMGCNFTKKSRLA